MINESWFDSLTVVGLREQHLWLTGLPARVERIVNFGCWHGSEPFALIWTFDAKEVTVVEIEEKNINELNDQIEIVSHRYPDSLKGRTIKPICRDMTKNIPDLPDKYYDIAYCKDVLYTLPLQGTTMLEQGISQMIRVIKPGGFIVAVESKFGAEFETKKMFGADVSLPIKLGEAKDMSSFFSFKELKKLEILGSPSNTYCYQRSNG